MCNEMSEITRFFELMINSNFELCEMLFIIYDDRLWVCRYFANYTLHRNEVIITANLIPR